MKKDKIGQMCFLKAIKLVRTHLENEPHRDDYLPFVVIGLIKNGYVIKSVINNNTFEVKTKDIYFENEQKDKQE